MERDSFIFYKEYKEAVDNLSNDKKKIQFYECITEYVFYGHLPENIDREIAAMFVLIKNKLDKQNKSYWNFEDRRSSKYKKWKEEVLKRDNYLCQECKTNENLVVHHIKNFSENINARFDINNGITLCQKCHREVHKNER